MRIAVVVTSSFGGLLHYGVQLADGIASHGHDVDVLLPAANELSGHRGPANLCPVLTPTTLDADVPEGRVGNLVRRAGIAARLARSWGQIVHRAQPGGYDAVLVSADVAISPAAASLLVMTLRPNRPAIAAVCHNVRIFNRWGGEELFHEPPHLLWLFRRLYPRLDVVFVHGDRSREEFERFWPPSTLAVVEHGDERIFAREPPPQSGEERLLFFGDWRKVKGLDTLMEAFDDVVRHRPQASLTIAGTPAPGDFDPDLVRAWAAGHGERVKVVDHYVAMDEVRGLFAEARAVVTPYHTGSQSGVIHLAQTMGRAVVTTDVGDLGRAVAEGPSGIVVPQGDLPALVGALEQVLADPALAARLGAAGARRVATAASWETVGGEVAAALATACERRAAAGRHVAARLRRRES